MEAKKVERALYKKALGYDAKETVEEYIIDEDGNKKLNKFKVTKKHIAPDIPAAKVLLEHLSTSNDYSDFSDEELEAERQRLIEMIKNSKGEEDGD